MARRLTTKLQRSGWRFIRERTLKAHTMRTTLSDAPSALARQEKSSLAGVGVVALIAIVGLLLSVFVPEPSLGQSKFFYTKEGGRYIVLGDTIHPVANIASARLILGEPLEAKKVSAKALTQLPQGPLVGIMGAPDVLTSTEKQPTWSVCSVDRDDNLTLVSSPPTKTYMTVTPVGGVAASVVARVTENGESSIWLIDKRGKRQFNPQDTMLISALGIPRSVLQRTPDVSPEFIRTLPTLPPLKVPDIKSWGEESNAIEGAKVGDVYRWGETKPTYVLVGKSGIQKIRYTAARALGADSSTPYLTARQWASTSRIKLWDDSGFPDRIPKWDARPVVCYTHNGEYGKIVVKSSKDTNFDDSAPTLPTGVSIVNFPTGIWVRIVRPAHGRLAPIGEAYISPDGTIYPLPGASSDENVAEMLGLENQQQLPERFVPLFYPGPALYPDAAKTIIRPQK